MATLSFVTHTLVSNIRHPFKTSYITIIILLHFFNSTFSIPIVLPDTENYLPSDDPNITNLMVSHYDCAKQHNLRQFNLLNVKQCTEAPSDIKHASVKARVYVRAKAKRITAFKCVAYAKKERKTCFQGSVKYRRVDRTVWNHNTLPLPVTLDPVECKNIIRHLNGTNDKILNNLNYNKTFTLLEDHYFQERLEQYQTPFTVYQLNKMYTGTFTFMPADKNWIYDPTKNPYHNCPAHHQFEVNLVSWRLEVSEIELTYDDTSNDMIIDGHTLPCYLADGFCKPTTKTPFTLVWFNDDYCLIFTLQDFIGRMTKIEDRYWIETDSFVHSPHPVKSQTASGIKGTEHPYVHAPHTQHPNNPSLSRFEVFPTAQTFCGKPDPLYSTQYSDLFVTYTDDFIFKAQLTSLYMHPTDYSFRLYDKNQDFFTSIASKIMGPYQYWLENGVKIFSLQFNFLRPSIYDPKTDESDPSFLSIAQKASHHQTYTKFLQYTKPQNYIFVNYKYTSPFTMTNMYTLDHSCITGYLRNYDPIKQYFCLLPYNNTSRPLIVPQEYLIHYDDFLLPCNIPTQIAKPLTVIKHLVSSPLDDKDRTYYTALYKQTYSYNELLFISAKTISFMVQAEQKTEHKSHTSPIKNTHDKLSSVLNNRTLRDITNLLEPYKRNSSETPITTLTHILHCYDRTHKLLQTLDLDSQRITQSSQAIQSALETITTLFNSTNLH